MSAESRTVGEQSRTTNAKAVRVTLPAGETSQLVGICIDPVDLRAKNTGAIDLAIDSTIRSGHGEASSEIIEVGS
jgi:hypothetical protein